MAPFSAVVGNKKTQPQIPSLLSSCLTNTHRHVETASDKKLKALIFGKVKQKTKQTKQQPSSQSFCTSRKSDGSTPSLNQNGLTPASSSALSATNDGPHQSTKPHSSTRSSALTRGGGHHTPRTDSLPAISRKRSLSGDPRGHDPAAAAAMKPNKLRNTNNHNNKTTMCTEQPTKRLTKARKIASSIPPALQQLGLLATQSSKIPSKAAVNLHQGSLHHQDTCTKTALHVEKENHAIRENASKTPKSIVRAEQDPGLTRFNDTSTPTASSTTTTASSTNLTLTHAPELESTSDLAFESSDEIDQESIRMTDAVHAACPDDVEDDETMPLTHPTQPLPPSTSLALRFRKLQSQTSMRQHDPVVVRERRRPEESWQSFLMYTESQLGGGDDEDGDGDVKLTTDSSRSTTEEKTLSPPAKDHFPMPPTSKGQTPAPHPAPLLSALDPIPALINEDSKIHSRRRRAPTDNFIKLNLKNKAGSCLGARNKKAKLKSKIRWQAQKENRRNQIHAAVAAVNDDDSPNAVRKTTEAHYGGALTHDGIDPMDDFLDGTFATTTAGAQQATVNNKTIDSNPIPLCSGHQQPCKQLTVKKNTTGNKGRQFFCCALARGEQCNFFKWADDTVEAAKAVLMKNKSYSGFVGRQVQSYMERIKVMTVPELRDLTKRNGLRSGGKKKELLMRLSLWARDELVHSNFSRRDDEGEHEVTIPATIENSDSCSDDSSSSSEELEFEEPPNHISKEGGESVGNLDDSQNKEESPTAQSKSSLQSSLQRYFGYSSFRGGQEWAIRRCLESKRSMLVAPTGSGKSLCYALPAALMEGVCIVVSPLLALIQDQIRVLPPSIPATTLSGQMSSAKLAATIDDISRGRIKIVFVSPEKLISASFRRLFLPRWNIETKQRERCFPQVSVLCVDEAHCLSQWAHNFRPAYLRLRSTVDLISPKSVLAITATAGPRVVSDVGYSLGIDCSNVGRNETDTSHVSRTGEGVLLMESDRDNIEVKCEVLESQEQRLTRLVSLLKRPCDGMAAKKTQNTWDGCLSSGSVIVYVWRKSDAEAVAETIQSVGVEGGVVCYHAGMDSGTRSAAQSKFIRGKARICVATIAFGLGINKADVEGVIHMHLSSSLEHYLQEIGRAGRDGRRALAISLILKDEVLVRHSLAYTDVIAMSQIEELLSLIVSKTKLALSALHQKPSQLSIGLPILELTRLCGCKAETVETILSLLEAYVGIKLLRLDGFIYDKVTIAPRRCSLEDLAKKEDVVKSIHGCSTCVEPAAGSQVDPQSATRAQANTVREHGFGSYAFSVTQCANLLGPDAEPRHVFAALRRLQQCRDIDFALDKGAGGGALNIRILECHAALFTNQDDGAVADLAQQLFELFQQSTDSLAAKTLRIDRILNLVSESSDPYCGRGKSKSKTLALFQKLTREYFESDNKDYSEKDPDPHEDVFDKVPDPKVLVRDLEPVLQHLEEIAKCQSLSRPTIRSTTLQSNIDLTALNATKFLHGIVPFVSDLRLCRQHYLFGKYQRAMFPQLHSQVANLLRGQNFLTRTG
ncbi:hypothetical protein ACA910_012730 [Epithemia clementina (nom. ined.)]